MTYAGGGGGKLVHLIALRPHDQYFPHSRTLSKRTSFHPTTTCFFDQPPPHPVLTVAYRPEFILRSRPKPPACAYMPACTLHPNAYRSTVQVDVFHKATGHALRFPHLLTSRFSPQPPVRHRFPISTPISYSTTRIFCTSQKQYPCLYPQRDDVASEQGMCAEVFGKSLRDTRRCQAPIDRRD